MSMTFTTTACPCQIKRLATCESPLAHQGCPCCMPFGPADQTMAPQHKSYHADAAVKRALAAERMQGQRGNGCAGTPRSGNVSSMTTRRSFDKPSSEAQRNFIRSLIAQRDGEAPDVKAIRDRINSLVKEAGLLTSAQASRAIEDLKAIPATQPDAAPKAQARTNKFAQACGNCKAMVEVGEGVLEQVNGRWMVWHKEGQCPVGKVEGVPSGHYAVEITDDRGTVSTLKFFYLDIEGKLFAQASDELHLITNVNGYREIVLSVIRKDVKEASLRYGREIGRCGICNRTLTDEVSRANGIGPVCQAKMSW
jgi:hypothetical protein